MLCPSPSHEDAPARSESRQTGRGHRPWGGGGDREVKSVTAATNQHGQGAGRSVGDGALREVSNPPPLRPEKACAHFSTRSVVEQQSAHISAEWQLL